MKLVKKQTTDNYLLPKDLSLNASGLLNLLLVRTNEQLENIDLYSISEKNRKDTALAFRELRKKKYILYSSLDDVYYVYISSQV